MCTPAIKPNIRCHHALSFEISSRTRMTGVDLRQLWRPQVDMWQFHSPPVHYNSDSNYLEYESDVPIAASDERMLPVKENDDSPSNHQSTTKRCDGAQNLAETLASENQAKDRE